MGRSTIPVDLLNPGQVFACLGLMEVAEVLLGDAIGGFDDGPGTARRFSLSAAGNSDPIKIVFEFIGDADICSVSPDETVKERDGGRTEFKPGIHPCNVKKKGGELRNGLLPIKLSKDGKVLQIEWWCDLDSGRPVLQTWTASTGNSASVRFTKVHAAFKQALAKGNDTPSPFTLSAPVKANFRLEMRRNWKPHNIGFSPDALKTACPLEIETYPCVELMATIGLTHARPTRMKQNPLEWGYSAWKPLPAELARPSLCGSLPLHECGRFRMILEKANKTDKSILRAVEENSR